MKRILRMTMSLARASTGDPEARHLLGEVANHFLNRRNFYGEWGKSWFSEARRSLPLDQFDDREVRRRWDRLWSLYQVAKFVNVEGDIAEFGVYSGASAVALISGATEGSYWGFDSFEGLSQPDTNRDGVYWAGGDLGISAEVASERLAVWGDRVTLVKGWIPDCFRECPDSVVFKLSHIDVDLYEPTYESLKFCADRTVTGGVIVCDDYGFETCPGARLACEEFLEENKDSWRGIHLTSGQALLLKG